MNLQEIRKAREFAHYLSSTLIPDLREEGRTSTAEDFEMAVRLIDRMGRSLAKTRTTITSVRKALKEHAA